MKRSDWNKRRQGLAPVIYRYRGYSPLPFLVVAVLLARPTAFSLFLGSLFMILGEGIRLWAVSVAGSETRSTRVLTGRKLVTGGPFAYVRNPIYVGNLVIYAGIGTMSMAGFPWLVAAAAGWFLIQYAVIVSYEESFLFNRFGSEYRRYFGAVNRFVPSLRRYHPVNCDPVTVKAEHGFLSERRTIQAETAVTLLFLTIYLVRDLQV